MAIYTATVTPGENNWYPESNGVRLPNAELEDIGRKDSVEEEADPRAPNGIGSMYIDSSDLELMTDGMFVQYVAIRFPSVDIAPNAVTTSAWLLFDVDEVDNSKEHKPIAASIHGEADVNSREVSLTPFDVSSRVKTEATVAWGIPQTAIVHEELESDDISSIVNEIVAMPGWKKGNPMTFILGHLAGEGSRWVETSRENNGIQTPALQWVFDRCEALYEAPCVDNFLGLSRYTCFSELEQTAAWVQAKGATLDDRCRSYFTQWREGASHALDVQPLDIPWAEVCPVTCNKCTPTAHDAALGLSSTRGIFDNCQKMLNHNYFESVCCTTFHGNELEGCLKVNQDYGGSPGDCGFAPTLDIVTDNGDWPAPSWYTDPVVIDASMTSPEACQALCASTTGCDFFSYEWEETEGARYHECYLKSAYDSCSLPVIEQYVPWSNAGDPDWHGVSGPVDCTNWKENDCGAISAQGPGFDAGGDARNYHGVPTDYATSCSTKCSWFIVPMWEACGGVLYYDSIQHGIPPPSNPDKMATFYQTCKPVMDANPQVPRRGTV
jgi:hypothetical protein